MTTAELYTKGARLWIPDNEAVWRGAEAVSGIKDNKLVVECEDGEQLTLEIKSPDDLPPLRNPDILIGENDLTSLSYLNEPEVLYNLQIRFSNHNAIYTYCGIVLVAINPYEELPIYGNDTIMAYRGQSMGDLDPHIFAVAEEAFTEMEREEQNQSIIVSGESGAGKTVSAKYAMRYFAAVSGSATETQVEKKVLASNPIMEAIGNAKTTRNDNSSRFGKYIEIDFNKQYNIIGANMRTYLLEKSRVVFQASEERNYHIFYQLCASADSDELKELRLGDQEEFVYTNRGQSAVIAGVDDGEAFNETRNAFTLLGFSDKDQMMIFRILAAILHLGNVSFLEGGKDGNDPDSSVIPMDDPHLPVMTSLLGIDEEQMRTWLCYRKIVSMREVFTKPIPMKQAAASRDALSKHIYAQLFDWIVTQINKSLASTAKVHKFIGVLDIYGFETFQINSFEQFCINYANEKLQQQFNQHVFKLEQEEYVREKIEWKFIDFYDNQPAIDLIESKMGVLDLLDEECKMPKGSDETWVQKLYDKCNKSKHFAKPRLSNTAFIVCHFADNVQYECGGFLEKNRDTVMEEPINILKASQHDLVAELFMEEADKKAKAVKKKPVVTVVAKGAAATKQHKKTVGSQFRDSLTLLMKTLNSTTPHYVRCIKPNDEKTSFNFNAIRAVQQLRACGVLETIRISAAGFPSRWTYQDFFGRYRVLIRSKDIKRNDMKVTSQNILQNVIKDEDKYQFGKTKIFFRAGQVAYLEKLRSDKLKACCIMIQKNVRGWLHRKRYLRIRKSAMLLQTYSRGLLARRHATFLRRTKAAKHIQRHVRGFVQYQKYTRTKRMVLALQSYSRGKWARQRFEELRRNRKAVVIQRYARGFLARQRFKKAMTAIVYLQSCVRRMYARRELKALKIEARSVEHIKTLNKGLENKIISLQQKIGEIMKENHALKTVATGTQNLRNELETLKGKEASLKLSSNKITELQQELDALRVELERERDEKVDLVSEKQQLQKSKEELEQKYTEETKLLKEELNNAKERFISSEKGAEEYLKKKVDNESKLLLDEFTEERTAHQKLLKEYNRLEQRYENLQNDMMRVKGTHHRTPSNISTISLQSDATEIARDENNDLQSIMSDNPEDDVGYASVRSRDSVHSKLDNIDWDQPLVSPKDDSPEGEMSIKVPKLEDVSLVLKLQQKLKEVEEQKNRLEKKLEIIEGKDDESPPDESKRAQEMIRLQELEMENAKQKDDLRKLRKAIAEGSDIADKELMDQFEALQDEQERRREECIQLRSVLANRMEDTKTLRFYGGEPDLINEDGELYMAFETQKKLIRQLEAELQAEKKKCTAIEEDLRHELKKLLADNERQQKLISQNLQKTPEAQTGAFMQHEITRLTGENLDLREKIDGLTEQIKKLKKQLKIYAKKLKDAGGAASKRQSMVLSPYGLDQSVDVTNIKEELNEDMPVVKHKEVAYLGMFEYRKEDESVIVKNLIYDLKPRLAVTLLPGLPAYILFMCVRHTDYINDDEKVRTLLTNTINGIKRVIRKRHEDLEITTMWLANTCRLLHSLKQYSGDKSFQTENTPKQNEQCLRNFDLSEYRQVLSDIAVWIYQAVIKIMEEKVQQLIVPSVLEHEAIPGISGKPSGMRGRSSSVARELESPVDPQRALDTLMKELSGFHRTMNLHGVDPELITQVFKQIFYFVCAGALNNLLLRKDMCHWSKGMQIRYNLSHLEQWCRDTKLQDAGVTDTLHPVIQASQLLQARKTDEDVQSICEMCDKLTIQQIIKILNLYTPADEFEERVPISFIRKIQAKLAERVDNPLQSTLLMDTKFAFPVRFPFNPSNIRLEDINIPDSLNLTVLKKV